MNPVTVQKQTGSPDAVNLRSIRIASPCPADWDKMVGDERVRHCSECNLNVYNLSEMTERQVQELIAGNQGQRLCLRLYRRADGTILTQDCPWSLRALKRRVSRVAAAVLTTVISMGVAVAKTRPQQNSQPATQSQRGASGLEVIAVDAQGAVVSGARIVLSRTKETVCVRVAKGSTDSGGRVQLDALPEGVHTLTVEAKYFVPATRKITLKKGRVLQLQFPLNVDPRATTTVEVGGADIPLVETTKAQVTHTYTEPHLQIMPVPSGVGAGPRPLRP